MNKKNIINSISENVKTIIGALIIAIIIRSFFFQPFYIPSSSMEPTLLIGDRIFVSKYTYGFSKHSFPFSPNLFNKRIFYKKPELGDQVVFKTPADNRTDYIKRLIGLPNDKIQIINSELFLNDKKIVRNKVKDLYKINCGNLEIQVDAYEEILPNGVKYIAAYRKEGTMLNSDPFIVPQDHFFFMGDNRDCSKDSRFLTSVGYVHKNNLVGKAQFIFFSSDRKIGSIFEIWKWHKSIRFSRTFDKIN